jgi:predicted alpha/beta hydrolase
VPASIAIEETLVALAEDLDWPPPENRLRAALWRAEGHLQRSEYAAAANALEEAFGLGEDAFARALYHLAAAGYKRVQGDRRRAERQLAHARRRLTSFLPEHAEVDVAALLELVERDVRS